MNSNFLAAIWLTLGVIGVIMFLWSELRVEKPQEITLSVVLKTIMLIFAGPLTIAFYAHQWGDSIVIWRRKK